MTEWRIDPILGHRSVVAPGRDDRPVDAPIATRGAGGGPDGPGAPVEEGDCPFCPGAEDALAELLFELPAEVGTRSGSPPPASTPWAARAVANRWPFVGSPDRQEVLIETPRHGARFATLTAGERRAAVELWWRRVRAARERDPRVRPILFRNEGLEAGASRAHPHAQLVLLHGPSAPPDPLARRLSARAEETGECPVCAEVAEAGERRVPLADGFAAVLLHAPLDPFHLRIVPTPHEPAFSDLGASERNAFADALGIVVRALDAETGGRAWNLMVRDLGSAPGPGLHWHVEIRPRLARSAGFEQSTGLGVCGVDPRDAADRLRRRLDLLDPTPDTP